MVPPPKKRKLHGDSPVVFHAMGQKPDVRIKVFDKFEFHVHSIILKLHSQFFLTLLNSPEKNELGGTSSSSMFKYEWKSQIDEDREGWHLVVSTAPAQASARHKGPELDMELEATCFGKMLCALYTDRYKFASCNELLVLTRMADYYRCLSILSRTLDSALFASCDFGAKIQENSCELLVAATKLRSALLFRESLIWAVSCWTDPEYVKLKHEDRKLYKLAESAYNIIGARAARIQQNIVSITSEDALIRDKLAEIAKTSLDSRSDRSDNYNRGDKQILLPQYLRNVRNEIFWTKPAHEANKLLQNNLKLSTTGIQSGAGDYSNYFLSAWLDDKDLPWDPTEKEW